MLVGKEYISLNGAWAKGKFEEATERCSIEESTDASFDDARYRLLEFGHLRHDKWQPWLHTRWFDGSCGQSTHTTVTASERTCNNISFTHNASLKCGHLRRSR